MYQQYFWAGSGTGLSRIPLSFSTQLNEEASRTIQGPLHNKYIAIQFRAGAWLWTEVGVKTITAEATMLVNHASSLMPNNAAVPVFIASDLFATRPLDMVTAVLMRSRLGWSEQRVNTYAKGQQMAITEAREILERLNPVHPKVPERYRFDIKTAEAILDWLIAANSTQLITNTVGRYRLTLHHARHVRKLPSWQCTATLCWQGKVVPNPIKIITRNSK